MGSSQSRARRHRRGTPNSFSNESDLSPDALEEIYFGSNSELASADQSTAPSFSHDTRAEQLSAQVADALTLALADARDPFLRDLVVAAVVPRRGAACLQVTLEVPAEHPVAEVQRRVQRAVGWLRSEVADAIERKRVPELIVIVVPGGTS